MKRTEEQLFNDCIEFFKIIENDGCMIKSTDERLFSLTNKKVSYFWRTNKDYIYSLICHNEYKLKYPNAYQVISSNYQNGYQLLSFDEKAISLYYQIEYDNYRFKFFSDGMSIATFIKRNIGRLFNKISQPKYKDIYPKAYLVMMKLYYAKIYEKLNEFLSVIEEEHRMITCKDKRTFKNGEKYAYFWISNKDIIMGLIKLPEFKSKYPKGCKIIKTAYVYFNSTVDDKCLNYIKIVNRNKSLLKSSDTIKLNCGIVAVNFAKYNYPTIYKLIMQDDMKSKYPIAYQLLMDKKKKDENIIKLDKLSIEEKCIEFYLILENKGIMINQKNEYKFSDGTYVKSLLMNNRELIYKFILKEEYIQKYPTAYQILTDDYKKYLMRKENKWRKKNET